MLIAALLSSLLLCVVEPAATEPEATKPEITNPEAKLVPAQGPTDEAPVIRMISNGDEPRSLARLALKVGDVQTAVMEMDMQMKMAMEGAEQPTPPMPTFGINMQVNVAEALPDGYWKYVCEFRSVDVKSTDKSPPEMVAMLKAAMSEMVGMKMAAEVDSLGRQRNFEIVSKITNPMLLRQLDSLKQSMAQMAVQLPEPEIGVGAKWEVDSVAQLGGIASRQRMTYRLIAREADTLTLGISMTQSAADRNAPIQNLPAGITGTLIDLAGDAKGEMVNDLTRIVPKKGRIAGESVVNMNMEGQGMKAKIDTHTTMIMTIRPATAADETPAQPKP